MARKIILLFVIFLASYLAAHFWLRAHHTVTDDVTKISRLVNCHPVDLRALRIIQKDGGRDEELQFSRVDQPQAGLPESIVLGRSVWKYSAPLAGEADTTRMKRIASTLCELYDPKPLRPSEMGADPGGPRHVLRLEARIEREGKAEVHLFEFGADPDSRASTVRYLGPDGSTSVVRIPALLSQLVSLPPEAYRNLKVMRLEADNIESATLTIGGKERFTLERSGADWVLREKGRDLGPASDEAGKFINRLSSLHGIAIEEADFPAANCEALPAKVVVSVQGVAGRNETVRFRYGKGGRLSACSSAGTMLFSVHGDMAKYLDVNAKSLAGAKK